jgi:hypothetical protein
MRAVVLSPATDTWLRLAQKQVKLCQVGVDAKERMTFASGRYLHERIPGSLIFDGERKRTRHVPRQTEGPVSGSRVVGGPKRDDVRETD